MMSQSTAVRIIPRRGAPPPFRFLPPGVALAEPALEQARSRGVAGWRLTQGGSRVEPGQRGLFVFPLDPFELRLHPVQPGGGLVVLVAGVGEVLADDLEGIPEFLQVAPQAAEARLDFVGAALDLEAPEIGR